MTNMNDFWGKASQTVAAFHPFYQESMMRLTQKYDSPNYWFLLSWVRSNEPEPFNLDKVVETVGPYATRQRTTDLFNQFTEDGFLKQDEKGNFILTDRGRGLIEGFFETAHDFLAKAAPLPADQMNLLRDYLGAVVEAALKADEPKDKSRLHNSRWTDPGQDSSAAVQIDQFVTDLLSFRDDVHIAVWKSYGVSWATLGDIDLCVARGSRHGG